MWVEKEERPNGAKVVCQMLEAGPLRVQAGLTDISFVVLPDPGLFLVPPGEPACRCLGADHGGNGNKPRTTVWRESPKGWEVLHRCKDAIANKATPREGIVEVRRDGGERLVVEVQGPGNWTQTMVFLP